MTPHLSDSQIDSLRAWALQGYQLSDIQKRLESEWNIRLTYMETRFLALDLKLEFHSPEKPKQAPPAPQEATTPEPLSGETPAPTEASVHVSIDEIARPGVMISGKVTFKDGENAHWYLDEMGRLGLDPATEGYTPSQESLLEFQKALQKALPHH